MKWGDDLGSEHERYLAEEVFKQPIIVYNYPAEIKAFYMRMNDDGKTVAAMDLLVPGVGELIGGSQREDRLEVRLKTILHLKKTLHTCQHAASLSRSHHEMKEAVSASLLYSMIYVIPLICTCAIPWMHRLRHQFLLQVLKERLVASGLDPADYEPYIDLRKYGSIPHSGFGLGFERLVLFATGLDNIRDIIPFPRWPGQARF